MISVSCPDGAVYVEIKIEQKMQKGMQFDATLNVYHLAHVDNLILQLQAAKQKARANQSASSSGFFSG